MTARAGSRLLVCLLCPNTVFAIGIQIDLSMDVWVSCNTSLYAYIYIYMSDGLVARFTNPIHLYIYIYILFRWFGCWLHQSDKSMKSFFDRIGAKNNSHYEIIWLDDRETNRYSISCCLRKNPNRGLVHKSSSWTTFKLPPPLTALLTSIWIYEIIIIRIICHKYPDNHGT